MANISKQELDQLTNAMKEVVGNDEQSSDLMDSLMRLLALPDEQFEVLAPGVMQSYQQTLNNPNDKIALVQALNATGNKADDLTDAFMTLIEEIDKMSLTRVKRDFLKEMLGTICNAVNDTEGIAKRLVPIPVELCHPNAKLPQYAHTSDSGMDVYALEDITIHPGETVLVPTGIKIALPVGFELQVRAKSGRALKTKFRIANAIGTIDQGYRDEIKVIIENIEPPIKDLTIDEEGHITSILHGSDFTIGKGEKFCQFILAESPKAALYRVDSVADIGENRVNANGESGFGSTGLK